MARVRVRLVKRNVRKLMRSDEMAAMLEEHAQVILSRLGEEYGSRPSKTDRAGVSIYPESAKARQDNYRNNTLLKAIQ